MPDTSYTVEIGRYVPSDPRLGRHVLHDSRSRAFPAPEGGAGAWKSVRHQRFVPVLNQGQVGSCTGNAAAGCLGTGQFWDEATQQVLSATDATKDETEAVTLYSAATVLDQIQGTYPPDDTGSTGLSVAKACKNAALISGYTHAFSLDALLTALSARAVIVGTEWTKDMFTPDANGQLHPTGSVAGGHEYVLDELDTDNQRVWMTNSWGGAWGQQGRAWFTYADLQTLLGRDGDCTIFTPITQPAPNPGQPTIQQGATGEAVRRLQRALRRTPDLGLVVDGVFGPATRAAVIGFQQANNLVADGVVGPHTWAALPDGGPMPLLQVGSTGAVVASLQTVLTTGAAQWGGITPQGIDGDFGPHTKAAVEAFQGWGHVAADGVVGDQTWAVSLHAASATLESAVGLQYVIG